MQDKNKKVPKIPQAIQQHLSNAKRHHYVPEFLFRRFSIDPATDHPLIYRLDLKTGGISKFSTINCAVIQHHNRLSAATGLPAGYAEAMLSLIESHAAPLIEAFLHGHVFTLEERVNFSTFLMVQERRTPRGREWQRFRQNQAVTSWLLKQIYENHGFTRSYLCEDLGREPSEVEMNEAIQQLAESLTGGDLTVDITLDQEILGMFLFAEDLIPLIGEMNWMLLEAPAGECFILSDDPLVRVDPLDPGRTTAWRSSPTVEATIPLDPHYCLRLRQPPPGQNACMITADEVLDINLRTYASAREAIFGPSEQLLERVHTAATNEYAIRVDLYRPKPPNMFIIEGVKGEEKPSKVTHIPGPSKIRIRRNGKGS